MTNEAAKVNMRKSNIVSVNSMLAISIGLLLAPGSASAEAKTLVMEPAVQHTQTTPNMQAELKLNGKKFEQYVRIEFSSKISLGQVRSQSLNGLLMKDLSDWVTAADFGTSTNDQTENFTLTIGKMGMNFTHNFNCQEQADEISWSIECLAAQKKEAGKPIINKARKSVYCAYDQTAERTICEFEMSGIADDLKVLFSSVSGSQVAFTLFLEDTSYLARLSLLISKQATTVNVPEIFKNSNYYALIEDLRSQEPNFENLPSEVIAMSSTQSNNSQLDFNYNSAKLRSNSTNN